MRATLWARAARRVAAVAVLLAVFAVEGSGAYRTPPPQYPRGRVRVAPPASSAGGASTYSPCDPNASGPTIWWISPTGSDANDGRTSATPKRTFQAAFQAMAAGDTLYVLDGTFAASGDCIGPDTSCSRYTAGPLKSGPSPSQPTRIIGCTLWGAKIDGGGTRLPLQIRFRNNVVVQGLEFLNSSGDACIVDGGSPTDGNPRIYHDVWLRFVACHQAANSSGTVVVNFSQMLSSGIEDSIVYGRGRYGIMFWTGGDPGQGNVARRNVIRYDGGADQGTSEPKACLAQYSEVESLAENNLCLDNLAMTGNNQAHWYSVSRSARAGGPNYWYGNVSLDGSSSFLNGAYWTDYQSGTAAHEFVGNVMALPSIVANLGMLMIESGTGTMLVAHNTFYGGRSFSGTTYQLRKDASMTVTVRDNVFHSAVQQGCNGGSTTGLSGSHNVSVNCSGTFVPSGNLLTTIAGLQYLLRVDPGSPLKGSASDGGDRGATIVKRYQNKVLTSQDLWPWPNEGRIKEKMCTEAGVTRGWCGTSKTLTQYVWEYGFGNPSPY